MAIGKFLRKGFPGLILSWGSGLRYPYLFLLTAAVFIVDVVVPDIIPFADEILIGMATLILARFKKKPQDPDLDETA